MKKQFFLISYIRDNQPMHLQIHSDAETMTVQQAQAYVDAQPGDGLISDVQVSKVTRTHEPGHYKQP